MTKLCRCDCASFLQLLKDCGSMQREGAGYVYTCSCGQSFTVQPITYTAENIEDALDNIIKNYWHD